MSKPAYRLLDGSLSRSGKRLDKVDAALQKTSDMVTEELRRRKKPAPITEAGLLNDLLHGKYK